MRRYLLATVSALALASTAQAADMRAKAPAQVIPVWNWTGWYIGAHAGVAWHEATSNDLSNLDTDGSIVTNQTGFIYGGQIGYNWQSNHLVWGIEADISGLTGRAKKDFADSTDDPTDLELVVHNKIEWLGTVRMRMGLAVQNTMAYVTGGLAYGRVKNVFNDGDELCSPFGAAGCAVIVSESKVRWGWTAGGGIEHMWSPNWSIKAEALFVDLGRSTATLNYDDGGPKVAKVKFSNKAVIGRIGINYRWGGAR